MVLAALFAALIAAGAVVSIPIQPVPFTFQVLFVLMTGLLLRPAAAGAATIVYLLLGVAGLPVFSGGAAGPAVVAGPTGGYILGFVVASVVISVVAGPHTGRTHGAYRLVACALGLVSIYGAGMAQLGVVMGFGPKQAFMAGVLPFIAFDAAKAVIAVGAAAAVERVVPIKTVREGA